MTPELNEAIVRAAAVAADKDFEVLMSDRAQAHPGVLRHSRSGIDEWQ